MPIATAKSAAEARKGQKLDRKELTVEILPNIDLENKGDWARLKFESTRVIPNNGKPFNVHDVVYMEGSLETMTTGKDKTPSPLKDGERVSLKGNARLDRGFAQMVKDQVVILEYNGIVKAGSFNAHDYLFDIVR